MTLPVTSTHPTAGPRRVPAVHRPVTSAPGIGPGGVFGMKHLVEGSFRRAFGAIVAHG